VYTPIIRVVNGECDIIIVFCAQYGRVNMNRVWNMTKNMIMYKKLDKLKIIIFCSKQPCVHLSYYLCTEVHCIIIL